MPTISVKRNLLFDSIGKKFSDKEFDELCFEFGIELDEVVNPEGLEKNPQLEKDIEYKIEIPANRYDLLCVEGLSRALSIFLQNSKPPQFELVTPNEPIQLTVLPNTKTVRPFVVAAILRNMTFTETNYASFIDLQDKLHQNLCRKRTLVAIGTHDLDTLKAPFRYDARRPLDISFKPLNHSSQVNGVELMELYSKESHLKPYLPIIQDKEFYPVIYDANDVVLSLPPIINGDHSKITLKTRNVFIECTATDLTKAEIVLDTMVTMFSQYCDNKFQVESVQVIQLDGTKTLYPKLQQRTEIVQVKDINKKIGIDISASQMALLLNKMGLAATQLEDGQQLSVLIPPTRSDILHACDIVEDVAIGYGFNNILKTIPASNCFSDEFELNRLTDLLRIELANSGYTEALTFTLCSREDVSDKLLKDITKVPAVHIGNPKTVDFQVARTTLLAGLLKTLASSKMMPLPLKIFECSDVVLKDSKTETGARNERRLAVVFYNKLAGFEIVHGVLDRVMQVLGLSWAKKDYHLEHVEDSTFMPGRCAAIHVKRNGTSTMIGHVGVLHPQVIQHFELNLPCCAMEINIEPFL